MDPRTVTIGELVTERPGRSRVFSRLGIDFCCGGRRTLADACGAQGLDIAHVEALLSAELPLPGQMDWRNGSVDELVAHIERTHHEYTKSELPRLSQLIEKVARVHGEKHPFMVEVAALFGRFADEFRAHLAKEELVLFPAICARAGRTLSGPVAVMLQDHDAAGADMRHMRRLTCNFTPPAGACNTFRAALAGLAELEADLHMHVHLENNVLFPRVLEEE